MTSVCKQAPSTPRHAARRRSPLDALLNPELFKVLGEPTRARILACLIKCNRPCSVTEIAQCCSIDFSVVSRHLGAMAGAGVLRVQKRGRTVWYEARSDELAAGFTALAEAIDGCRRMPSREDACDC